MRDIECATICLFLGLVNIGIAYTVSDYEEEYNLPTSNSDSPELIQHLAGHDIKLQCGFKENPVNALATLPVQWYYKPCGNNINQISCKNVSNIGWTQLRCDGGGSCKTTLYIPNATVNNSGLYKCTMYPYDSNDLKPLRIQFVRIYKLQIRLQNSTELPEFLDNTPSNITVDIGSQVVFQCRVQSKTHLTIKWFRRLNLESDTTGDYFDKTRIVQYSNKTYKLIESSGERILGDIYLSKLILNSVTESDSGYYACVPLNYRGHRIREAYLNVEYLERFVEEKTHPVEFLLLFLMPLGLALVPLCLWFCFIFSKRYSRYKERNSERIDQKKNQQNYVRVQVSF